LSTHFLSGGQEGLRGCNFGKGPGGKSWVEEELRDASSGCGGELKGGSSHDGKGLQKKLAATHLRRKKTRG